MILNGIGGLMMIAGIGAGFLVGGLVSLLTPDDRYPILAGALVCYPIATGLDVWYRRTHHRERGRLRWIGLTTGGMFMFLPVWFWFGALPVGVAVVAVGRKALGLG